ncbi:MAG: HAD family hydrolase [Eubacterium sp.]
MKNIDFLRNMEGAIFDLDGTILDSSWVWDQVDIKFLGDRGFKVPDDYVEAISPLGAERAAAYTIERFGLNETPDDLVREWFDIAREEYAAQVICKPFAKEYIKSLYDRGVKLAVATSSDRQLFMATLKREDILRYFSHIVTVNEVERGKGYPDIYEKAAERLRINPHKCVVFEDILTGVSGAKMGEFNVIAVHDEKSDYNKEKIQKIADYYIESFKELL